MPKFFTRMLAIALILGSGDRLHAQLTDSEASATWLAGKIAESSGGTADQYYQYARSLAKTLSLLSTDDQLDVLTDIAATGGGGGGSDAGGGGDAGAGDGGEGDGESNPVMDAIADDTITSPNLLNILLATTPIDPAELMAALDRDPQMDPGDVAALMDAYGPLENGQMVSALENADDNISSDTLREMLLANSPVDPVVLEKVATTTKMTAADKAAVVAANTPGG